MSCIKQPFFLQPFLHFFQFQIQITDTGRPHGCDHDLQTTTGFIDGYIPFQFHFIAIVYRKGGTAVVRRKHHTGNTGFFIFQGKIPVAAVWFTKIGYFPLYKYTMQYRITFQ